MMKIKKLTSTMIFLVITMIAYVAASLHFCYTTKPEITNHEFPFSITYEYKGETKTLSGIFECEYSGSSTIHGEHRRYWEGESKYINPINPENPHIIEENEEMQTVLAIQEDMYAGYFMGDPMYKNHYSDQGLEVAEPYIEYYDYKNNISLNDENRDEILESIGFKLIDYTYEEPIENSFSFSGSQYEADNVTIFIGILLVFFILCLIFVRKDKEYQYTKLDKIGIGLNFLVGIVVVPFTSVVCMLFGIVESNIELVNQITYSTPPFAILCLALSVVFRRKGFSKPGFYIQFGGIALFLLILVLDVIF